MKLPFHKKPRVEIVPVGNENTGILYFKKIWGRTGSERSFVDDLEFKQATTQLKLLKLARKISKDKNKTPDEVLELISTNSEDPILLDYLTDIEELLELRNEERSFRDKIVTLFINERMAYPVSFSETQNKGAKSLDIEPTNGISQGSKIKVGSMVLELAQTYIEGYENLVVVEPLFSDIKAGSIGFQINKNGEYIFGNSDWKLENTQNSDELSEQLKDAIFEFYQLESIGGELPSNPKKEQLTNESKTSKNSQVEPSQIGKKSTTKSSATESQAPSSMKQLELIPTT